MDDLATTGTSIRRNYWFDPVSRCNMCGADVAKSRQLGMRLDKSQGRSPRSRRGVAVSVCQCTECELIFADPQPVPRSISDHYGVPPESYWSSVNYNPAPNYFERQLAVAKRLLDFQPGMKAIDVGFGLGKAARVMRGGGFDVYGFEPSEPFYKKGLEILNGDAERFKLATIEEVEFEAGAFDFVSFGAVLEHVYDPDAALKKAMRWLKPGGIAYAEIPNARHLVSRIINAYYRLMGTTFVTHLSPMHVPYHLHEFSLDSFVKNGQRNDYSVAEHWVDVARIYHLPRFLHPMLRRIMDKNETGMQLTVWMRKNA